MKRPPFTRGLAWMISLPMIVGLCALMVATAALSVLRSEALVPWLAKEVVRFSAGRLALRDVSGTLAQGVRIGQVHWRIGEEQVELEGVRLSVSWRTLARGRLLIETLSAEQLTWTLGDAPGAPSLPATLHPPIDLTIDRIQLAGFTLRSVQGPRLQVRGLSARLSHEQGRWHVTDARLTTVATADGVQWVGTRGLLHELTGAVQWTSSPPYALAGQITGVARRGDPRWHGLDAALDLSAERPVALQIDGSFEHLRTTLTLAGRRAQVSAEGAWALLSSEPMGPWAVRFEGLDPAALPGGWPQGRWSGRIDSDGSGRGPGRLELRNALPGPIDAQRWPIAQVRGRWSQDEGVLRLDGLEIDGPAGTLQGQLRVRPKAPGWQIDMQWRDPNREADLNAQIVLDAQALTLSEARLSGPHGQLDLRGKVSFPPVGKRATSASASDAQPTWRLEGRFEKLNLARWIPATAATPAIPHWLLEGPFMLTGRGLVVSTIQAGLQWGESRITIRGGMRTADDRLEVRLTDLPLDVLRPGLSGRGSVHAVISGAWPRVALRVRSQARGVSASGQPDSVAGSAAASAAGSGAGSAAASAAGAVFDRLAVQSVVLTLNLPDARVLWSDLSDILPEPLEASVRAQGIVWGATRISALEAGLQAVPGSMRTRSPASSVTASALPTITGLLARTWQGQLLQARVSGEGVLVLDGAIHWRWTGEDLVAEASRWTMTPPGAAPVLLALGEVRWGASGARLQARSVGIPVTVLGRWLGGRGLQLQGPDALTFSLEVALQSAAPAGLDQWQGQARVSREQGDLRIQTTRDGPWLAAQLQTAVLVLDVQGADLSAHWEVSGLTLGRMQGQARAVQVLGATRLNPGARLQGSVRGDWPSLAFARALVGEVWQIDGTLQADLALSGTLGAPRWSGTLTGRELQARQRELGMVLTDGELQARLIDDRLDIERLDFRSGEGRVRMSGVLRADERSEARLVLERFPIPLGAGQRLVLSGQALARLERGELHLRGAVRADEGVIEITSASTPRLAADVRVRGASALAPGARGAVSNANGFRVFSDLQIDLGDRLRVFGGGLDARLTGAVQLTGRLPDAPRVQGTVRVRGGTYRGFGQELQIERGTLVFSGDLEDPAIDVLAWRRFLPVEAGVNLAGTARRPLLTLVSRPEVPDPDKLSWLVLGTSFDSTRGGQNAALQAAAAVLIAGTEANSPVRSLISSFGLDMLAVRTAPAGASDGGVSGTFAQDSIITLGKRLTDRLFLSYEQSLRGLQNLFRLQYQITDRLTVRARAGSQQALDLIWSRRYD